MSANTFVHKNLSNAYVNGIDRIVERQGRKTANGKRDVGQHQYAQSCYENLAGKASPIKGGDAQHIDRDTHLHAYHEVMRHLGHNRVDVGGAYYGSHGH